MLVYALQLSLALASIWILFLYSMTIVLSRHLANLEVRVEKLTFLLQQKDKLLAMREDNESN